MGDVLRRGYRATDAHALAELMNDIEKHAGGHPGYLADELQRLIDRLVPDPARDSVLVFGPDGVLLAAAFATTPPAGGYRVFLTGGVHPQWRGRGLGRELLRFQLDRAVEIHRVTAPTAQWRGHFRTPTDDTDAARLFRRFGVTPVRYWFEMSARTAVVPEVPVPAGLRLATYSPVHEAAVHAAHMEAFTDAWGHQHRELDDWAALTVRGEDFLPELSLVAFAGAELVGYSLTYDDAEPGRVTCGHLGVRRPWRGRGLATALLAGMLAASGRAGQAQVSLSVDAENPTGALGVYERCGFATESRSVTYEVPI